MREEEKYVEEADYPPNETQLFLEKIFSRKYHIEGFSIIYNRHIIDFKEELYENFEIYKENSNERICFGYWDSKGGMIRWFINREEVDLIKGKLKLKELES